jgi:hypothetical protein
VALADDLRALRDRTLSDLNAAHDYYADTINVWNLTLQLIAGRRGRGVPGTGVPVWQHLGARTFTARNAATGTVTTDTDLVQKAQGYISGQLAEATFQQFLSIFESFFFDLLRLWLRAYPQSLGKKVVEFQTILDAPDKDAVTSLVVAKEVLSVVYKRPAEWFAYLEELAKLGCPTATEVERLAEAKASRDLLVHDRGIANATYEFKAGRSARYKAGERIEIPENYHREVWELIRKIVANVSDAAIKKFP